MIAKRSKRSSIVKRSRLVKAMKLLRRGSGEEN